MAEAHDCEYGDMKRAGNGLTVFGQYVVPAECSVCGAAKELRFEFVEMRERTWSPSTPTEAR